MKREDISHIGVGTMLMCHFHQTLPRLQAVRYTLRPQVLFPSLPLISLSMNKAPVLEIVHKLIISPLALESCTVLLKP